MNKYQEALKVAYEMMNEADWSSANIGCNALKTLQKLVDKETPKKVVLHYKHHLGTAWGTFVSRITCPSCNRRLKDTIPNNQMFCPKCGQRLDWSKEYE